MSELKEIELGKLAGHPDNPNRLSGAMMGKLAASIKRTGKYQPLVVRPLGDGDYQIINGHHRKKVLEKMGVERAECLVWDVDEDEGRLLLMSLNRLGGSDDAGAKKRLLEKLSRKMPAGEISKLIPDSKGQVEKLVNMKKVTLAKPREVECSVEAMVFFVDGEQKGLIEEALGEFALDENVKNGSKAKAAGLAGICEYYLEKEGGTNGE